MFEHFGTETNLQWHHFFVGSSGGLGESCAPESSTGNDSLLARPGFLGNFRNELTLI
jgi:hypothetical protein